jgi:hypothetical protein
MQTVKAYFENKNIRIRAQVVGFDSTAPTLETFMYSNPLSIYSGVNNPIKIQCLNSDQKRINVSNVSIQCGLFEPNTENELLTITALPVDTANGVVEIIMTPADLAPLQFGDYEIAVTAVDNGGNVYPIYINDFFGSRLKTHLRKGPVLAYADATPITFVDEGGVGVVSGAVDLTVRPINSTVATLCCNLQAYTGNILAQVSMTTTPTPTDWGNVSIASYSNVSGFIMQSVIGQFAKLRFILPEADPTQSGNVTANSFVTNANIRI